ncbi:MAG: vanadium-dependent haloperoxidase [Ferruginibacter sp.]
MKRIFNGLLFFTLLIPCSGQRNKTDSDNTWHSNLAYKWAKIVLEATANDTEKFRPRPTVTSRMLALTFTAMFDAWSRFDNKAIPVYLEKVDRVSVEKMTLANKEIAISYAAYRAMSTYFYSDSLMLRKKMLEFGYNPDDESTDPTTPQGIGNLAAKSVIDARINDGANQYGSATGSSGISYSDYTGYKPTNNADSLVDVTHWQPKYFSDGKGGKFAPACLTPHWGKVRTLLLDSGSQFRCQPPPALNSTELKTEVQEVVDMQAALTNEDKGLIEFMRDGPRSVQQAGHWLIFAQEVSERDKHSLDEDVKMYFAMEAAAMDAFVACWDTKMKYDFARPYTLVHHFFKNKRIKGWGGPGKGIVEMWGQEWRPYSPETFLCPPFPSYVSGHSTVSGACSEILKLFTGSDYFGITVARNPGEFTDPDNIGPEVLLKFDSFSQTAEMAGKSRVLGGYHIRCENEEGLKLGKNVAAAVWRKYLFYVGS